MSRWWPFRFRRRRIVPAGADSEPVFPAEHESSPPWPVRIAAQQLAIGIELATVNRQYAEREWLIATADRDVLNEAMRALSITWLWAIIRGGERDDIRPALEADARRKAAMHR